MAVGRIGWVKKAISAVAMIALVFGLSVRPAFAAEAPAGEGSSREALPPAQHLELGRVQVQVLARVQVQVLAQAQAQALLRGIRQRRSQAWSAVATG